jgi:hypothetical protein
MLCVWHSGYLLHHCEWERERESVGGPITRGVSPCLLAPMAQITGTTNNFLHPHCFSLVK